jgi:tellurite resistance-related uncharacterized protein
MRKDKQQLHIWIPKDIFKTAEELRNITWQNEGLTYYRAHSGSQGDWFAYLIMLGMMEYKRLQEEEKAKRESGEKTG